MNLWKWHIVALVTALVWSTTFVSTKKLLGAGLAPEWIFFCRFLMAYICLVPIAGRRLFAANWRQEGLLLLCGITGGSLYFLTENTALEYTYATNVSIIISVTPLLTMAVTALVFHQPLKRTMLLGSLLALAGVSLVVLNGRTDVGISPIGDLLTLAAALCWAVYTVIVRWLGARGYSVTFITRKIFFYGLVTILFYLPFSGHTPALGIFAEPVVWGNLLFLGIIASLVCFLIWNRVVEVLGPDKANNYIYLSPLGAMATAVAFLGEPVSWMAVAGAAIAISGVVIVEKTK